MASTATRGKAPAAGNTNGHNAGADILEGFEMFTGGYMRGGNDIAAVTASAIELGLNDLAYTLLGRPGNVNLLFNAATRTIAIKPGSGEASAYRVRHPGKKKSGGATVSEGGTHFVTARAFMAHYNITLPANRARYAAVQHGNILLVDLNAEPLQVFSGARTTRAPAPLPAGRVTTEGLEGDVPNTGAPDASVPGTGAPDPAGN